MSQPTDAYYTNMNKPIATLVSSPPSSQHSKHTFSSPNKDMVGWNDEDAVVLSDTDFDAPCPCCAEHCPYLCCCFALSRSQRQHVALSLLYAKGYLAIYVLIIAGTVTLLTFDLATGNLIHDLRTEPTWFISLDVSVVCLMVFDVVVQLQAHPRTYWRSAMNIFDFIVVALCVCSIPVYFYVPDSDFILTVVLLLRFAAQLLRIVMVYKHHANRQSYMATTRDDLVDFTGYEAATDVDSAQGRSLAPASYQNASLHDPLLQHVQHASIQHGGGDALESGSDNGSYQNLRGSLLARSNVNTQWE